MIPLPPLIAAALAVELTKGAFGANDFSTLALTPTYYLERWDANHESAFSTVELGPNPPHTLACSATGQRLLAAYDNGAVVHFAL